MICSLRLLVPRRCKAGSSAYYRLRLSIFFGGGGRRRALAIGRTSADPPEPVSLTAGRCDPFRDCRTGGLLDTEIAVRRPGAAGMPAIGVLSRERMSLRGAWVSASAILGASSGGLAGQASALFAMIRHRDGDPVRLAVEQRFAGAAAAGYRGHEDDAGNLVAEAGGGADRGDCPLAAADEPNRNVGAAPTKVDRLADRRGIGRAYDDSRAATCRSAVSGPRRQSPVPAITAACAAGSCSIYPEGAIGGEIDHAVAARQHNQHGFGVCRRGIKQALHAPVRERQFGNHRFGAGGSDRNNQQ